MEKFHHFLYDKMFQLKTDQKPLENELAKSVTQATPRIQVLLMRTLPYDFNGSGILKFQLISLWIAPQG